MHKKRIIVSKVTFYTWVKRLKGNISKSKYIKIYQKFMYSCNIFDTLVGTGDWLVKLRAVRFFFL